MKPARFEYAAPTSLDALLSLLSCRGRSAALLAGGQSLLPLLHRRRLRPELVIDLNRVTGIGGIVFRDGLLRIGAMTRQREIEFSELVAHHAPLLTKAVGFVGNPATRNRGTLGGSIAFADPLAELPAAMVCLGATFWLGSEAGKRPVPAAGFFRARQKTALLPSEAILAIEIPSCTGRPSAFMEVTRRARDQAMVGVAARVEENGNAVAALFGVAEHPVEISEAGLDQDWQITYPLNDENLGYEDRQRIARTLARRAFRDLAP